MLKQFRKLCLNTYIPAANCFRHAFRCARAEPTGMNQDAE